MIIIIVLQMFIIMLLEIINIKRNKENRDKIQ